MCSHLIKPTHGWSPAGGNTSPPTNPRTTQFGNHITSTLPQTNPHFSHASAIADLASSFLSALSPRSSSLPLLQRPTHASGTPHDTHKARQHTRQAGVETYSENMPSQHSRNTHNTSTPTTPHSKNISRPPTLPQTTPCTKACSTNTRNSPYPPPSHLLTSPSLQPLWGLPASHPLLSL